MGVIELLSEASLRLQVILVRKEVVCECGKRKVDLGDEK